MPKLPALCLAVMFAACQKQPPPRQPEAPVAAPAADAALMGTESAASESGYGFGMTGVGPGASPDGMGTIGAPPGHGAQPKQPPLQPMRFGEVRASEGLDRAIVRRYLRHALRKVNVCYEQRLAVQPGLKGTLLIDFSFGPDGLVTTLQVIGIADDELLACTTQVLRAIRYPKPEGGQTVSVTTSLVLGATP